MNTSLSLDTLFPALRDKDKVANLLKDNIYVGIDFGTSNTVVSVCSMEHGAAGPVLESLELDVIPQSGGERTHLIPSVLCLSNNRLQIGQLAKAAGIRKGEIGRNYLSSFKMELGEAAGSKYHQFELARDNEQRESVASNLANLSDDEEVYSRLEESMKIDSPKMATQAFFMTLKIFIDNQYGHAAKEKTINYSVSIPACFESAKRRDYRDALNAVGINVAEQFFVDEPNAAFLAWLAGEEEPDQIFSDEKPVRALVFDFGAGTCDISLLEAKRKDESGLHLKNLALSKFAALGGDDVDRAIALKVLYPQICKENNIDPDEVPEPIYVRHLELKLRLWAEKLKVKASRKMNRGCVDDDDEVTVNTHSTAIVLPSVHKSLLDVLSWKRKSHELLVPEELTLTFAQFNECVTPMVTSWASDTMRFGNKGLIGRMLGRFFSQKKESCIQLLEDTLSKTGSEDSGVDYVLLTGGSSNLPQVEEALGEHFGEDVEIILPRDMQSHVSKGVALHSFLARGLNENPITEILAEDIFIHTKQGERILFRAGTEIPEATKMDKLFPGRKNQRKLEIPFLAGEARRVVDKLNGKIPRSVDKKTEICMEAHVDRQKILHVTGWYQDDEDGETHYLFKDQVISPYARETSSEYEAAVGKKETELHNILLKTGFIAGEDELGGAAKSIVRQLIKIHKEQGNHRECLSLYEQYLPNEFENMGYHAIHAGEIKLNKRLTLLAFEKNRSGTSAYNLAIDFPDGSGDWCKYMGMAATEYDYPSAKFYWGQHISDDDPDESERLIGEAFAHFKSEFEKHSGNLEKWEYFHLKTIAKHLGDTDTLTAVKKAKAKKQRKAVKKKSRYEEKNLLSSSQSDDDEGAPVIKLREQRDIE